MPGDWVTRKHPSYEDWKTAEDLSRASYIGRRKDLAPYLVPHVFEEETPEDEHEKVRKVQSIEMDPRKLRRAKLGFGIGLNDSYLSEVLGHVRGAPVSRNFGPLDPSNEGPTSGGPSEGSSARRLWEDLTRRNTTWKNFFHRTVLDWMLSSPGGLIVVDAPAGESVTAADDEELTPFARFVPWSQVFDVGRGERGFRWVKLTERVDARDPKGEKSEEIETRYVLYELQDDGSTEVSRWDEDGDPVAFEVERGDGETEEVSARNLGTFQDRQGDPTLPIVNAGFGEHPDVSFVGSGLLIGQDEIVVDLFNLVTEIREGFRDEVFSLLVHKGPEPEGVRDLLKKGSRFVALGDEENVSLTRVGTDAKIVSSGETLVNLALKSWAESARRKAAAAQEREMSGVALQAEFQLDLAPLLREIAGVLDDLETNVLLIAAQFVDRTVNLEDLRSIDVTRDDEFRPEDEASRISRIVREAKEAFGRIPSATALSRAFMRWAESTGVFNLDQEVELQGGETVVLRDLLRQEAETGFQNAVSSQRQRDQSSFPLTG